MSTDDGTRERATRADGGVEGGYTGVRRSNERRERSVGALGDDVAVNGFRLCALAGILALIASFSIVLYDVTTIVSAGGPLVAVIVGMLAGATVFARSMRPRVALVLATAAGALGFAYYLTATGMGLDAVVTAADEIVSDTVALATGYGVDRMIDVGTWSLGFAPAPVFLSWYLALRRRYVLSVIPGGLALFFLVLSGDASMGLTLLGTAGAIAGVGFGELDRRDGALAQADLLAIVFAVMIVLSLTVTFVPTGTVSPTHLVESDDGTLESTIDSAPDRSGIGGGVELSPEVRFSVVADEETYWRTGTYDRFTGSEWVRTGQTTPYEDGYLQEPPGAYETNRQTITVRDDLDVMPVSGQPLAIDGEITENTLVSPRGDVHPDSPLIDGDTYNVESAIVDPDPDELRAAGTDYPEAVTDTYLQLPDGTSTEFERYTAELTADAENPYETAALVEQHLRSTKGYSLEVEHPGGNVAEGFLFEMDEGYCVYFATTMVTMLRAEDVPARYVTGYTSGQQVDDHEWVVRGLDAHAWVEVYFPDHGWVAFEPTPPADRDPVHDDVLEQAREDGVEGVDIEASEDVPPDGISIDEPFEDEPVDGTDTMNESDDEDGLGDLDELPDDFDPQEYGPVAGEPIGGDGDPELPDEDDELGDDDAGDEGVTPGDVAVALAVVFGLVATAHRTGVTTRARREVSLYWHGFRSDPNRDVERAYWRLERLLAREFRPRRRGEPVNGYLSSLSVYAAFDPRARRVGELYERARYGDGVDRVEADEAIELVDDLVQERTPLVGRFVR